MRKTGEPTSTTDLPQGESFLGRWSRRKQTTQTDTPQVQPTPMDGQGDALSGHAPVDASTNAEPDTLPVVGNGVDKPPVLTDADMPALESLGDDDDYSGFMSTGVSEALRNKALRRLFSSAQFNVLDGLNDYDDDFTSFEPLGDIITSDMRHRMEVEAKKAAEQLRDEAMSGEPSLANAQHAELGTSTEAALQPHLDSKDESPLVDDLTSCDDSGEPVATNERFDAGAYAGAPAREILSRDPDEPPCPGKVADESSAATALPRSDTRDG